MTIIVDSNEDDIYVRRLKMIGLSVEKKHLEVGDYVAGDVLIERKTVRDFLNSLFTRSKSGKSRLWSQMEKMKKQTTHIPLLVVHGKSPRGRMVNSLIGAIVKIFRNWRIPVILYLHRNDTDRNSQLSFFTYLLSNIYLTSTVKKSSTPIVLSKKSMEIDEIRVNMISQLPNVGLRRSIRLLNRFGTIQNLVNAKVEEIASVKGISLKTARFIKEVLCGNDYECKDS